MTIKEIARLANVSSAAVSRYLNGGYVSEKKRAQIKKVIEETGYHPSAQARTLRTKRACLIGVVAPKINSESISRITEGIGNVLSAKGYQMLLASTDNNAKKEIEYLHLFEKYPVDGIILIGTMITAEHRRFLKNAKVPVVVTGQYTKYTNCIYHDDYGAGKAMGRLAASLSHGHVAYIGVTREDKAAGAAREDGSARDCARKAWNWRRNMYAYPRSGQIPDTRRPCPFWRRKMISMSYPAPQTPLPRGRSKRSMPWE